MQLEDRRAIPSRTAGPTEIALYDGLRAASQHAWPSLRVDLGALAGRLAPLLAGRVLLQDLHAAARLVGGAVGAAAAPDGRARPGAGASPTRRATTRRHAHCDVLVVGGGPAGLAAALAAGRSGARVILADGDPAFGGALLRRADRIGDGDGAAWAAVRPSPSWPQLPEVRLLPRDDGGRPLRRQLPDRGRAGRRELARRAGGCRASASGTSAPAGSCWRPARMERPLVFPGNDRPGIMLASAVETYRAPLCA